MDIPDIPDRLYGRPGRGRTGLAHYKCESKYEQCRKNPLEMPQLVSKLSLGVACHFALDLHFSFQSIALLVDFVRSRNPKFLQIKLSKIINMENVEIPDQHYEQNYMQLNFQGNSFSKYEAEQLANCFYENNQSNAGMGLVLGMFGVGKTGIFINDNGRQKMVIMFSVDDRVNPNYYKDSAAMIFIENNVTKAVENMNGKVLKRVITEAIKLYHPQPDKILDCKPNNSRILIFHPKIFISSNKLMFYEIRESNLGHDIDTHHNPDKVEFLNKLSYEISIHSQFRLSCYLNCLYLRSPFPIRIGESDQPIIKTTYIEYLETIHTNGLLTKIPTPSLNGALRVQLYETLPDKYFMLNNGILLYYEGRMINRFGVEFGRMLEEMFYKKRYRSPPRNIWNVVGVIELDTKKFKVNLIKNRIVNDFEYRRFVKDVQIMLDNIAGKSQVIVIENEQQEEGNIEKKKNKDKQHKVIERHQKYERHEKHEKYEKYEMHKRNERQERYEKYHEREKEGKQKQRVREKAKQKQKQVWESDSDENYEPVQPRKRVKRGQHDDD